MQAMTSTIPTSSLASSGAKQWKKPSSKTAMNRHVEDTRIHIPTPKAMAKAAVSEAIAAAWIGNHRTHEGDGDPDDQDMFFEPDGKRRRGGPLCTTSREGRKR